MKIYGNAQVTLEPVKTIPLLIACARNKADGVVAFGHSSAEEARRLGCVRVIDEDALDLFVSDERAFVKEYGSIPATEGVRLLGLLQLVEALKTHDKTVWELALDRASYSPHKAIWDIQRPLLERQPGVELARLLAEGLTGVQLVLWWKEERRDVVILPGLRCPDARSALYALAWLRIAGGEGLGACLNCGKPLVTRRRMRRLYCSNKCKMAWHRSKKAHKKSRKLRRSLKSKKRNKR
jgi:hypothetical protein